MSELTRESVKPLLDLQKVDSAVDRLHARRADLPEQRELDELNEQRHGVADLHAERGMALDAVAREQAKLENETELIEQKSTKERERLDSGSISSPKEMMNVQAELDALARRKTHLEDQTLDLLEQREELETEVGGLKAQLDELDAKITDATQRRDAATVEIDKELGELAAKRQEIAPTVPEKAAKMYEDLRPRKGGIAVGALEDGTCRACGLPLSPMSLDEIKHSDEPLPRCENCRRLLIVL